MIVAATMNYVAYRHRFRKDPTKAEEEPDHKLKLGETASIDVRLRELYRTPKDNFNESIFDLFLRFRLELTSPGEVQIKNFRFQLSLHGVIEAMEPINDLNEWEITTWDAKAYGAEMNELSRYSAAFNVEEIRTRQGMAAFCDKANNRNNAGKMCRQASGAN